MSTDLALETTGLEKAYPTGHILQGRRPALVALDLSVQRGEIFGYLGPNGSGKTTTLKLLLGLLKPDRGTARILGYELSDPSWRYRVGYVPENPYLYDYLTAREYVRYAGRLFGLSPAAVDDRTRSLLELVGLDRAADQPLRTVSKGMLQRVALAQALINDPDLVFMDEPMSGLDPMGRRMVRTIILDLKRQGKTIFFSTHILADAETLCDRVALLRAGRLVASGRLDEILTPDTSHMEVLVTAVPPSLVEGLGQVTRATQAVGERWRLDVPEAGLLDVLKAVGAGGGRVLSVQPIRQTLEEYFMQEMQGGTPGAWGD